MMAGRIVYRHQPSDSELAESTRELTRQSREMLEQRIPDTFLGRKTQEPFSREEPEAKSD